MTKEELRRALDDSVLTHTGRSIGDLASQRVVEDVWPLIEAREATLRDRATSLLDAAQEGIERLRNALAYAEQREREQRARADELLYQSGKLRASEAQMREIVQAVANVSIPFTTPGEMGVGMISAHTVEQARALLAGEASEKGGGDGC